MRKGVRIGVDVGGARTGVAVSDPDGIMATPRATLHADGSDVRRVAKWTRELDAMEVVVGLPLNMDGSAGPSAQKAWAWARKLARKIAPVPVRMMDERLSTVTAHQYLRESGVPSRRHRQVVDQQAAVIILDTALEQERSTGAAPGRPLEGEL
ncbi:Holliday junction resolvase RuvX [Neoactinobaculum massilliense]|uniref:Holliday junction resolvase RuvX n=1 Tax=Neoactinobaculum massilliense TaxID=2364794 RepID=UPI000F541A51|nr:Holliday junction resolvase RuvX [Neoactinobaculum massilliense]